MRTDLELLARAERGEPPVFRCYIWTPAAVSLGRHQPESDVDKRAALELGFDIVRRPTGGRAVVHQGDLSFAWVFPKRAPWPTTLRCVYSIAGDLFRRAFTALGLKPDHDRDKTSGCTPAYQISPLCFADLGCAELTLDGRKAVGWAARVTRRAILLHGTLYIHRLPEGLTEQLLPGSSGSTSAALAEAAPGLSDAHVAGALYEIFSAYHRDRNGR